MSLNNLVSIENFDDLNDTYILRSPNRGKLYRGPNWNAFNRENLGSIPKNNENILFREKNSENKKGFMSQTERFNEFNKYDSIKYSYPGPGNYSSNTSNSFDRSISTNPSFSSKGYGVGFVSTADRFDETKEYYEKYYPGPGQYRNKGTTVSDNESKHNLRFKSLYNTKEAKSLKISKDNPGPCDYYPIIPIELKKETNLKPNHFFTSKNIRFKNETLQKQSKLPGPGNYFFDLERYLFKNPDQTSHFFKKNLEKSIDPLEKHLNIPKVQKFHIPGPGEYNLRKEFIDESKFNERKPLINPNENDLEKQKESEMERLNILKKSKNEIFEELKSSFGNPKKAIKSVFVSQSPKNNYLSINHVPGPSYYKPQLPPAKLNYNFNDEKKWI